METIYPRSENKLSDTVEQALAKISKQELEINNWPILTKVKKETFRKYNDRFEVLSPKEREQRELDFWKEIFNQENFISPNIQTFDPEKNFLFVLHSRQNEEGLDSEFLAITTTC